MDKVKSKIIDQVDLWLREFIIKLNLCPFAARPYANGQVLIEASEAEEFEAQLLFFQDQLLNLSNKPGVTSLLIFSNGPKDFMDFLDFVAACEELRRDMSLASDYQLIGFHPQFQFDGVDPSERANWVNRSAYPMIHVLASEDIEAVLIDPAEAEKISLQNEAKLNSLSQEEWTKIVSLLQVN